MGIRWCPGKDLFNRLSGGHTTWTDFDGKRADLTVRDIVVVAAYNAQVRALKDALPEGANVGGPVAGEGRGHRGGGARAAEGRVPMPRKMELAAGLCGVRSSAPDASRKFRRFFGTELR